MPLVKRTDFLNTHQFSHQDIINCGAGELFGVGNAQLPTGNMLMIDKITRISEGGGKYGKGEIVADFNVHPSQWFFGCHFYNDPVMPGCLGLDAMWQMLGFYLAWLGYLGRGRARSAGSIKFSEEILSNNTTLTYVLSIKKISAFHLVMGIADGEMYNSGKIIYTATDLKTVLITKHSS